MRKVIRLFFIVIDKIFRKANDLTHFFRYKVFRLKYDIHDSFKFNGRNIEMYGIGQIICGPLSYIGAYSTWQSSVGCRIEIGKGCHISHNVRCYTESNLADADFSIKPVPSKKGDVIIGDYVWIGANVFICPGVKIGDNSVIGANSVITKDIPSNSIFAGAPAKLIREKKKL